MREPEKWPTETSAFFILRDDPNPPRIEKLFDSKSIIFTGGGNPLL
jgi:hypothetical protein